MRVLKFIFTLCLVLLLALFANGFNILMQPFDAQPPHRPVPLTYNVEPPNNEEAAPYYPYYNEGAITEYEQEQTQEDTGPGYPVNMLVLGLDGEGTRSDVILLLNFRPGMTGLNILSISRDTMVFSGGKYCKINALYSKGGELLLAQKISQMTGLPIHYYITMDFTGFRKIVDTLGGVWFNVPFKMSYDDPAQRLHIYLKKGPQLLDGSKAEQLVRYRKGNAKGSGYTDGDIGRIKMQQEFLKALIGQKLNFWYISKADDIFGILQRYVKTNITVSDLAQYASSAGKIRENEINAVTTPGTSKMVDEAWYYIIDRNETRKIINSSFYK